MKTTDIIRRAGRSLRDAKARTILTSLAIAVGAFTVTLSIAAGTGTRDYTDKLISSNVDPQLLVIAKDKNMFSDDGGMATESGLSEYGENKASQGGVQVETLKDEDIKKIAEIDGVERIEPVAQVQMKYVEFEGTDKKYVDNVMTYGSGLVIEAAAGSLPGQGQQLGKNDIIIPEIHLEKIGYKTPQEAIGKKVTMTLERSAGAVSEEQLQTAFAQGGPEAVAKLAKTEQREYTFTIRAVSRASSMAFIDMVSSIQIAPSAAKEMSEYLTEGTPYAGQYVLASGSASKDTDPAEVKKRVEDAGYVAQTAKDFQSMIFSVVNILQGIVIGFGVLALIASVFGIINTQYISVLERTQQIGLMKALGTRGKDVGRLFRYEAASLGLFGGIIGAGLAIAVGMVLNPWITETLGLGDGNYLLIFEPLSILILILVLVIIAIVAGYFPARKAAKLDPIEALRTE